MSAETTTRERSTTTALMMTEMTYEQLVESQLTKMLYLIHGTGSDRDRTIQLSTLRKWILEGTQNAVFQKIDLPGSPASVEITNGHVKASMTGSSAELGVGGLTVDGTVGQATKTTVVEDDNVTVTGGNNVSAMTKLGLNITDGYKTLNASRTAVTITDTGSDAVNVTLDKSGLHGTVNGTEVAINKDRVRTASLTITSITDINTDYNGLPKQQPAQGTRGDVVGDIVLVHNTDSVGHKVYLNSVIGGSANYVSVNAGCTIPFRCTRAPDGQFTSGWSPMANMQIY